MKYRVELETHAKKEFLSLSASTQALIADVVDDLQLLPRPPGSKKLAGRGGYRVRKGDYRVLYTVDDRQRLVRIYRIGHRRDVYR